MRLVVGMTGATGAPFGVRLLENLRELPDVETHLVLSRWARTTIELETGLSVALEQCIRTPGQTGVELTSKARQFRELPMFNGVMRQTHPYGLRAECVRSLVGAHNQPKAAFTSAELRKR